MNKIIALLIFLVFLAFSYWYIDAVRLPIQEKVLNKAQTELSVLGLGNTTAEVDGRDITLKPAVEEDIANLVEDVRGVRSVNRTVSETKSNFKPVLKTPAIVAKDKPEIKDFIFSVSSNDDSININGDVPNKKYIRSIESYIKASYPDVSFVNSNTNVNTNSPDGANAIYSIATQYVGNNKGTSVEFAGGKMKFLGKVSHAYKVAELRKTLTNEFPTSLKYDIANINIDNFDRKKAELCQAKFNKIMTGDKIQFKFGTTQIEPASYEVLKLVKSTILECPDNAVIVEGHTDSKGSDIVNKNLSLKRASAVADYLVAQGAEKQNLLAIGYGSKLPIVNNDTEEGRATNRRIEFRIEGF